MSLSFRLVESKLNGCFGSGQMERCGAGTKHAQGTEMIAKLKGLLDETGTDWAVIDVQGVGYLVHCSARTLAALGETGRGVHRLHRLTGQRK